MVARVSFVVLGLATLVSAGTPAQARDLSPGAAAAVGVLGGLAIGGAIAGGAAQGGYYPGRQVAGPRPVYGPPPEPVYVEEAPPVECYVRRRRFENEYGDVTIRRERVCE
jgi:hypothetical protein